MNTPSSFQRPWSLAIGLAAALVALGVAAIVMATGHLWPNSGIWTGTLVFAEVWGLALSALARGSRSPARALRLATAGALLCAGSLAIAGFGLLQARLSAESIYSLTGAHPLEAGWALHAKLAALHGRTLAAGAVLLVPFMFAEVTLWWMIRRRERDVAGGDPAAAHESTEPRVLELGGTLLLFAFGAAVLAGSYAAPVPFAQPPAQARLQQIQRSAAQHKWDAACSQLRTAVGISGARAVEHDLHGARRLARLCIDGRIARLDGAGIGCEMLAAGDEPLATLAGGNRRVIAICEQRRRALARAM